MPQKVCVSDADVEWLERAVEDGVTYTRMAEHIGCNVDTLKRILMREGLAFFEGAKYVVAREQTVEMWSRPCIQCGSTSERPKWQYICDPCKDADTENAAGLPNNWL